MTLSFQQDFTAPGAAFRGKPFWAWNGKLEPDELRRQIRVMHRMGLGGFFMHARVGLDTAYLSKDWFACVDACIDEARKLGMEAWLYDEDRWPSGAAGGLVTKNPKYRMRSLLLKVLTDPAQLQWTTDTVAAFTAFVEGDHALGVQSLARGDVPAVLKEGQCLLVFVSEVQGCSPWYNGYTYLDTLSHEAVKEFLDVTHDTYLKEDGKYFGRVVPGIFTDEPNHGNMIAAATNTGEGRSVPWTPKLLKIFKKRYGYDLLPHLVELFFDVDGQPVTQPRYHYHDCVTFLFVDAFGRQIGEWCEKHKLQFTGHLLEEDTLSSQTNMVGDCMRFYEHMQAPGMDLLTEYWRVFNTAKQVSSAARQFGRKWRLTETYGCTGWDFPFAGHKALGDWQVALGINLRAQHLAWYTMLAEAKRDYPAAIFYQSPWWEDYAKVEDYFARVLAVMTRGAEVRDLLVLHPVESAWLLCKTGWRQHNPAVDEMDWMFNRLSETLLSGHVDFDFGNEELMSRHARVRHNGEQAVLAVGKAEYRAVLVPPMTTMRASTLKLLKKFQRVGGQVIFAGDPPQYVEALPTNSVDVFAQQCARIAQPKGPELVQAVAGACRRISIADEDGNEIAPALYLLREDAEASYLFICNTGEDFSTDEGSRQHPMVRDRQLAFPTVIVRGLGDCLGVPLLLDPETGTVVKTDAERIAGGWEIRTSLPALASRLFVVPKTAGAADYPAAAALTPVRVKPLPDEPWAIRLSEANNLVLDRPRYRIGDGDWQEATEILRVDRAVRAALGIPGRSGYMVQPWARKKERHPRTVDLALSYAFTVDALPSGGLFLALEKPETFQIMLNGQPISLDAESGWWVDRSLRTVPLDGTLLKLGKNELTLACRYAEDFSGLEIAYLLGQFGTAVRGPRVAMTALPATLQIGDWCAQGLSFYAGSVTYQQQITPKLFAGERLFVRIPDYRGTAVRVSVDGQSAGIVAWEPNEVDITALVGKKPVTLQITVIGHRRNSHGPHHLTTKWPEWTGPGEFQAGGDRWYDGYQLVPCGLLAPPELVVKK